MRTCSQNRALADLSLAGNASRRFGHFPGALEIGHCGDMATMITASGKFEVPFRGKADGGLISVDRIADYAHPY